MSETEIKKPVPPCTKECENRRPGCGAECKAWLAYVAERNAIYQQTLDTNRQRAMTDARIRAVKRKERTCRQQSSCVHFRNKK